MGQRRIAPPSIAVALAIAGCGSGSAVNADERTNEAGQIACSVAVSYTSLAGLRRDATAVAVLRPTGKTTVRRIDSIPFTIAKVKILMTVAGGVLPSTLWLRQLGLTTETAARLWYPRTTCTSPIWRPTGSAETVRRSAVNTCRWEEHKGSSAAPAADQCGTSQCDRSSASTRTPLHSRVGLDPGRRTALMASSHMTSDAFTQLTTNRLPTSEQPGSAGLKHLFLRTRSCVAEHESRARNFWFQLPRSRSSSRPHHGPRGRHRSGEAG